MGCKWIFKKKLKLSGSTQKNKKDTFNCQNVQNKCVDYFDTFALIIKI